jgi:hypothetical protein
MQHCTQSFISEENAGKASVGVAALPGASACKLWEERRHSFLRVSSRVKAFLTASEYRAADFEMQISELQKRVQASASCHFLLSVLD